MTEQRPRLRTKLPEPESLYFCDDHSEALLVADEHYRQGQKVQVVRVTNALAECGREIRSISRYVVVRWNR